MTIDIPDWLKPVAWAAGTQWPEADEDALRRMGEAWTTAAGELDAVAKNSTSAAERVLSAVTGETHDAFAAYWKHFAGAGESFIPELQTMMESIAEECEACALDVEYTKMSVIAALAFLAAQIAILIANAIETFGASTAGIPIAQLATRTAVWAMMKQLVEKVATTGTSTITKEIGAALVKNLATNVGTDVAIQGVQYARGDRHSWDIDKTTGAVISAGVGTVTDVAGGHASGHFAGQATTAGRSMAAHALGGVAIGTAGGALDAAAHGKTDWASYQSGMTGGAVAGTLGGGTEGNHHITEEGGYSSSHTPGRHEAAPNDSTGEHSGQGGPGRHEGPPAESTMPDNPPSVIVQDGKRPGESEPEAPDALPATPLLNLPSH